MPGMLITITVDELKPLKWDGVKFTVPWSQRLSAITAFRAVADELERREKDGEW